MFWVKRYLWRWVKNCLKETYLKINMWSKPFSKQICETNLFHIPYADFFIKKYINEWNLCGDYLERHELVNSVFLWNKLIKTEKWYLWRWMKPVFFSEMNDIIFYEWNRFSENSLKYIQVWSYSKALLNTNLNT